MVSALRSQQESRPAAASRSPPGALGGGHRLRGGSSQGLYSRIGDWWFRAGSCGRRCGGDHARRWDWRGNDDRRSGLDRRRGQGKRLGLGRRRRRGAVSIGSGVTLASGLIVALGNGFAVVAGVGFGFVVGVGVSSETAGVLAWNGVEAASCARPNAAVASSTIARTNERM